MKEITLTQGKVAIVDDDDFESLSQFNWHFHAGTGYARRGTGGRKNHRKIYMHREVMRAPTGVEVDHIHGNLLDNRKSELRLATHRENTKNQTLFSTARAGKKTSRFKGVCRPADSRKWLASITVDGEHIRLGVFTDETDAARAYDAAAREYFGEFARCNFANHKD